MIKRKETIIALVLLLVSAIIITSIIFISPGRLMDFLGTGGQERMATSNTERTIRIIQEALNYTKEEARNFAENLREVEGINGIVRAEFPYPNVLEIESEDGTIYQLIMNEERTTIHRIDRVMSDETLERVFDDLSWHRSPTALILEASNFPNIDFDNSVNVISQALDVNPESVMSLVSGAYFNHGINGIMRAEFVEIVEMVRRREEYEHIKAIKIETEDNRNILLTAREWLGSHMLDGTRLPPNYTVWAVEDLDTGEVLAEAGRPRPR